MGIQINGQNDTVSASDGSINITGEITSTVLNQTVTGVVTFTDAEFSTGFNVAGVVTATQLNVGSGVTISDDTIRVGTAVTISAGIITATTINATSFSGDGSGLTGAGSTTTAEWVLGADGVSNYTFTGPGVDAAAQDPTIYLVRGERYLFKNRSGGHPFRIQTTFQDTGGTAYNDGIVNNAAGDGTDLYWEVKYDTPDVLYYQCTAHTNMSGKINMISGENKILGLTTTTSAARDAGIGTAVGSINYVPATGLQVYVGSLLGWRTISGTAETDPLSATGGTIDTSSRPGYKVHTFTGSGNFVISSGTQTVEYLVIAGGGGGGGSLGGGGAGGYREGTVLFSPGTHAVTIGGGGAGGVWAGPDAVRGVDSSIVTPTGTLTSAGGGAGLGPSTNVLTGGSGGGGRFSSAGGAGNTPPVSPPQGNPGGNGTGYNSGAGGGGAGAAGNPAPATGGVGGAGASSSITGSAVTRAGGGGGGYYDPGSGTAAAGGAGGGGAGGYGSQNGTAATANTGGGGGGSGSTPSAGQTGGNGGSGVVIIAYQT